MSVRLLAVSCSLADFQVSATVLTYYATSKAIISYYKVIKKQSFLSFGLRQLKNSKSLSFFYGKTPNEVQMIISQLNPRAQQFNTMELSQKGI